MKYEGLAVKQLKGDGRAWKIPVDLKAACFCINKPNHATFTFTVHPRFHTQGLWEEHLAEVEKMLP